MESKKLDRIIELYDTKWIEENIPATAKFLEFRNTIGEIEGGVLSSFHQSPKDSNSPDAILLEYRFEFTNKTKNDDYGLLRVLVINSDYDNFASIFIMTTLDENQIPNNKWTIEP